MRVKRIELLFEGAQLEQELARHRKEKVYPLSHYLRRLSKEHLILPPVRLVELKAVAEKKSLKLKAIRGGFNAIKLKSKEKVPCPKK